MPARFQKILVPYDFSRGAARALAVAIDLAAVHDGALMVMHAIPPIVPLHGAVLLAGPAEIAAVGRRLATEVAAALGRRRVRRVRSWVMAGTPAECILAASRKADAIVMGTLGRTGFAHLLLGSVAERVVRHSAIPVLTVRAKSPRKH
jgi:nucleotide-binding universal stress UspA family protein